ncbi:MAG: HAD family hydrolase [Verrucomicrobiota bacterium]
MNRAVFLDRDGVLVEDVHLLTHAGQLRVLPGVPAALARLKQAGFQLIVASNQTVVARGMATEDDVRAVNEQLNALLANAGGARIDAFYVSPFHPNANLPAYRRDSDCRKPRPGLLLRAAVERQLDLRASFMIGDRISDVIAGHRAGCRTVLVQTGKHDAPPIESGEAIDTTVQPDHVCAGLPEAADWILAAR